MMSRKYAAVGVIIIIAAVLFYTIFIGNILKLQQKNFVYSVTKSECMIPEYKEMVVKYTPKTATFIQSLSQRFDPTKCSTKVPEQTELNVHELERYSTCIKNGPRERNENGSQFWNGDSQHIRTRHHTYLKNTKDAIVFEIGGNKGEDADELMRLYSPRWYLILEPLEEYSAMLTKRYNTNSNVTVANFGLSATDEVIRVKVEGHGADATSKFSANRGDTPLHLFNASRFFLDIGIGLYDVDLITINCEGCEYDVLEALVGTSLTQHFKNIQFATHSTLNIKMAIERYCRVQEMLSRTHRLTYQYKFIWENWRLLD